MTLQRLTHILLDRHLEHDQSIRGFTVLHEVYGRRFSQQVEK